MKFISDPPIAIKIEKMRQRVKWQDKAVVEAGIDQTRLMLDDGTDPGTHFSFLVIGDTGAGDHWGYDPQRHIAEQMMLHREDCRFVLHTGDVVYLVGSSEYYYNNFIYPYQNFLVGGHNPKQIAYDRMVFDFPFFLVPGNHDYYDLPWYYGALSGLTLPLRRVITKIDFDAGWHGSHQGKTYARAFLDCLSRLSPSELSRHLEAHYTAKTETGRCLRYQPGQFTRLPNRYYSFRYGGIDFFAIDSNTFNAPLPIPATQAGLAYRSHLEKQLDALEQRKQELMMESSQLDPNDPEEAVRIDDCRAKIEQIDETGFDIEKQLESSSGSPTVDTEQLDWLKQRLIESWQTEGVRGRVIFFHHPPYVTEATKWSQAQTLAIRQRLREVLNEVAKVVAPLPEGRSLVDLILNGHAHCLEYIRTFETGQADSNLNWIVCGGSGYSLRRQRPEGPELPELYVNESGIDAERTVARSHLFVGRTGHRSHKRRPYSFLRIDVRGDEQVPQFTVRPFVAERSHDQWQDYALDPFDLPTGAH